MDIFRAQSIIFIAFLLGLPHALAVDPPPQPAGTPANPCPGAIAGMAPPTPGYLGRGLKAGMDAQNNRRPGGGDKIKAVLEGLRDTEGATEAVEAFLTANGATEMTYFARGTESLVFDLGNGRVAQVGWGTLRRPPSSPLVNQQIDGREFSIGPRGREKFLRVEIYEKLDTESITSADFLAMKASLAAEGLEFSDRTAGKDQLGRNSNGRVLVLDPGAVRRRAR